MLMEESEPLGLKDEVRDIIEEARMVLPGIQALFGFQFVAVLNTRFAELESSAQVTHICSLLLVALATALIMAPAAYHRIAERSEASRYFADLASRFITTAMLVLLVGISIDLFIIANMVLENTVLSATLAFATGLFFAALWFGFPLIRRHIKVAKTAAGKSIAHRA
jgi:uncharacterized membrane-anchored protein